MMRPLFYCSGFAAPFIPPDWSPPTGTPLANQSHPRIFITDIQLPALRDKIKNYYGSDFTAFIKEMDAVYNGGGTTGSSLTAENLKAGDVRSFAFLKLIDPATLPGSGAQHTATEYGLRSIALAVEIANAPLRDDHHATGSFPPSGSYGTYNLTLMMAYDWCFDLLTTPDKFAILDRLEAEFDSIEADASLDPSSMKTHMNNKSTSESHRYLGVSAFFGDDLAGSILPDKAQTMLNHFYEVSIRRQVLTAPLAFSQSCGWHEGGNYTQDGLNALVWIAGVVGSVLGENLWETNPYFRFMPYFIYYNSVPFIDGNKDLNVSHHHWVYNNSSSERFTDDHSSNQPMNACAAMLAVVDPALAGLAGWYTEASSYGLKLENYPKYHPRTHAVYYKFLWGAKHVSQAPPQSPAVSLSARCGEFHGLRSSHDAQTATLIQFWCTDWNYSGGHRGDQMSSFFISKYGPLATNSYLTKNSGYDMPRGNAKGDGFHNIMTVYTPQLDSDGNVICPFEKPSVGPEESDHPQDFAEGRPTDIGDTDWKYEAGEYDYFNYDYTKSFSAGNRCTQARRQFVYLRGAEDHEFVVILDRIQGNQERVWIMHTPTEPQNDNGNWQGTVPHGATSSDATQFTITNNLRQGHGRMFVTSLYPAGLTAYKFGGDTSAWHDVDGQAVLDSENILRISDYSNYWTGGYSLQFRANSDLFLTILQIGDANSMSSRATVEKIDGPAYAGCLLEEERLCLFSKTENGLEDFSYTVSASKTVKHLLTDLSRLREITVTTGNRTVISGITSEQGTYYFSDQPGGNATYQVSFGKIIAHHPQSITRNTLSLLRITPNPAQSLIQISYELIVPSAILMICNAQGQLVLKKNIFEQRGNFFWEGRDQNNQYLPNGLYSVHLQSQNSEKLTEKIVLIH